MQTLSQVSINTAAWRFLRPAHRQSEEMVQESHGLSRAALKGARARVELTPALQVFIQGQEERITRRPARRGLGQYLR